MNWCRIAILICALGSTAAHAYELATHARLTDAAYTQSILKDSEFIKQLGINANDPAPFGTTYYDVSGTGARERERNAFERRFMADDAQPLSIAGWLMGGAIREDDYPSGPNPVESLIVRPLNHFYDPIGDRPLTLTFPLVGDIALGEKAPNWAIGTSDMFANPVQPNDFRNNHFTVFDAREALYRALTGKDSTNQDIATSKVERDKYWATTFRALGDVVHLVQDMGQPQHTRNDPHAGNQFDGNAGRLGHKSVYENYIEARATGAHFQTQGFTTNLPTAIDLSTQPLDYGNYTIPQFNNYTPYFTERLNIDLPYRQGLADYSNRGFFSAGTNLGNNAYSSPVNNDGAYSHKSLFVNWAGQPIAPNGATVDVLFGTVPDSLTGIPDTNIPLTTRGIWDQFLETKQLVPVYTLNRYNYDAMANLLIPRAVAYSAGLINYFFRGKLAAEDAGFSDQGISLRIKNAIDVQQYPNLTGETLNTGGTVVVAYDYKMADLSTVVGSSPALTLTQSLTPGQISDSPYTFTLPPPPIGATDIHYRLVFRGLLGQEKDAIAVGKVEPVSGFAFHPNYLPGDGIAGSRNIYNSSGVWKLSNKADLAAGNIDWKGWYVNGIPTKVLSWVGPAARYFTPSMSFDEFTTIIYQAGEVFALAPAPVLGAALMKDSGGKEWLIAICFQLGADVVYRRPNKKGNSPALFNAVTNPEGWQQIGSFTGQTGGQQADTPWFFNSSGTEAQTMRWALRNVQGALNQMVSDTNNGTFPIIPANIGQDYFLDRLKIQITDAAATLQNLGNSVVNRNSNASYSNALQCTENCPIVSAQTFCIVRTTIGSLDPSLTVQQALDNSPRGSIEQTANGQSISATNGTYVVAVDYIGDTEVLAEYITDAQETDVINIDTTIRGTICQDVFGTNNFYPTVPVDQVALKQSTWAHNFTSLVNNRLRMGSIEYPIKEINFDISSLATETKGLNNFQENQDFKTPKTLWRTIQYADLRNATLLYLEDERNFYQIGPPPHLGFSPQMAYDRTQRVILESSGNKTTVTEKTDKNINPNWSFDYDLEFRPVDSNNISKFTTAAFIEAFGIPINPSTNFPYLPLFFGSQQSSASVPSEAMIGGIATDTNNNIFASLQYVDQSSVRRYFNFLTNGDPTVSVPLAPDGAHYDPIMVIK